MSKQLERVLPILTTIPGVNIPATLLQGIYIAASQRKMEQFEGALRYEVNLLNRKIEAGKLRLDREYIKSDAFAANVVQALRAAEVAESENKLHFIARALVGCSLSFSEPRLDRSQTLRIIEGMSEREMTVFVTYFKILDSINLELGLIPLDTQISVEGLSRQEFISALLGIEQLGLLTKENLSDREGEWVDTPRHSGPGFAWKLTGLARQVANLSRFGGDDI
ncbi:hypothetical protein [Deinococcus marmoris]|uniref:hypothetical protein n=1 Tax=Deinococcus marmoris TaxID=249408 RepID=UPI0012DC64D4|nr:hypothetical protein [Deinococcus marmoris]